MMSSRKAILMLSVLLVTSLSPVLADGSVAQIDNDNGVTNEAFSIISKQNYLSTLDEEQKLQLAIDHWSQMSTPQMIESSIKPSSGILNLAIGLTAMDT